MTATTLSWFGEFSRQAPALIDEALLTLGKLRKISPEKFVAVFEDEQGSSSEGLTDLRKACKAIAKGRDVRVETLFSIIDFEFYKRDSSFDVTDYVALCPDSGAKQLATTFKGQLDRIGNLMETLAVKNGGLDKTRHWLCQRRGDGVKKGPLEKKRHELIARIGDYENQEESNVHPPSLMP